MAIQKINIGSSPNKGDGDPLRIAFDKINDNFEELYAQNFGDPENQPTNIIPATDGIYDLGSLNKQWADLYVKDFLYLGGVRLETTAQGNLALAGEVVQIQDTVGSVFGDDSTVLVDGVNSSINLDGTVKGNIIPDTDIAYDLGSMTHRFRDLYLSGSTINLGGLEIANDGGVITFGGEKVVVEGGTGDVTGSVFADDSTLLVDGVNGKLTGLYESGDIKIDGENGWIEFKGSISFYGYNPENTADYNGESLLFRGGLGDGVGNTGGSIAIEGGVGNDGATGGNVRLSPGGTVGGDPGKLYITNLDTEEFNVYWLMLNASTGEVTKYSADSAAYVGSAIQANGLPNNTRFSQGAPSTSKGSNGDTAGSVTFDSDYIYYCTTSYTDGVADIWKRVAWSGDTW